MPQEWLNTWDKFSKHFTIAERPTDSGHCAVTNHHVHLVPTPDREVLPDLNDSFEDSVQRPRKKMRLELFSEDEKDAILALIESMLQCRPSERATISQVLRSEWFVKWCLPEYERFLQSQAEEQRKTDIV